MGMKALAILIAKTVEKTNEFQHGRVPFVDDSKYFGDPAVTKKMIEHVPEFYEFTTAITGGLSEFRWR